MKRYNILILFILLLCQSSLAEVQFSIVPPRTVIEGQNFAVTFRLKDATEGSALKVPEIEGCRLLYGPATSTMQSYQNIGGRMSSSVTVEYTYTYRAEKAGEYTIAAASINVDGKTLQTKPASLKVLPPDKSSGNDDDVRIDDPSTQNSNRQVSDKDVFIRIILNKSKAYKEEAIECVMKLYTKYSSISGITAVTPPSFDGFLIEEDNSVATVNDTEHYNGQNYLTAVLKKYIIFPQKTGKLTINSGKYDITVVQYERVNMGFFSTSRPVEKSVHVNPGNLSINILPLPEPQPANFSGAVGNFKLESDLSSNSLRTNEAATLSLTITGSGDIKYIKEPQIDFPVEFEQYTPRTDINSRISGNTVTGTTSIEYTFVPQAVGDFTIAPTEFVYFDPSAAKYVTLSTPAYQLKVAKGVSTAVVTPDQQSISAKNTDILHIKTGDKTLKKDRVPVIHTMFYWAIYIAIVILLIIIVYAYSKQIKLSADVTGLKMARANKVARKRLKEAKKFMNAHQNEKFYEEILKAIWGYLSDKLAIPASQLTRQNISESLAANSMPDEMIERLLRIIDDCEMARYTPGGLSDESVERTFTGASSIMNEMENIKKQ